MIYLIFAILPIISITLSLSRFYIANKNRDYETKFEGKYSVIVAVFSEDPTLFEKCLSSIITFSSPVQLVVTVDDSNNASDEIISIAKKYTTQVILVPTRVGKRHQYAKAAQLISNEVDVIITVDSDTIWNNTTISILNPFTDSTIGAVGGRQKIFEPRKNYIRSIAQWVEDIHSLVTMPYQSYFGEVNIIFGRTLAARADIYKELSKINNNEKFLGRRLITSDDASMTLGILSRGYKTVYQSTSVVYTDAPNSLKAILKQYLRWQRGTYRRFFHRIKQMRKMNPIILLSNLDFLFFNLTGISLTVVMIISIFIKGDFSSISNIAVIVILFSLASIISIIPKLPNKKNVSSFILYIVFMVSIFSVIKFISMLTFFENGWMTRDRKSDIYEDRVRLTRFVAASAGMVTIMTVLIFCAFLLRLTNF